MTIPATPEEMAQELRKRQRAIATPDWLCVAAYVLALIAEARAQGAAEMRGRAIKACVDQQQAFLSEEYAVGQPLASFSERFACGQCIQAIREMPASKEETANAGESNVNG